MKSIITFSVCLCLFQSVCFSSEITIGQFLSTARNDSVVKIHKEADRFLKNAPNNTPYIRSVELRTETDEFQPDNQEYSVRVYPNGWGETQGNKNLYHTTLLFNESKNDLALHRALKTRYTLVLDMMICKKNHGLKKRMVALYSDKVNAMRKQAGTATFDIRDMFDTENRLMQAELDIIELKNKQKQIRHDMQAYLAESDRVVLAEEDIIDIDCIATEYKRLVITDDNLYVKNCQLNSEMERHRYELEKAQNRRYINYLQFSYDNEERTYPRKAYSLELGILLPFISDENLDINRRKVRYLSQKGRQIETEASLRKDFDQLNASLDQLIEKHALLTKKRRDYRKTNVMKKYQQVDGVDPVVFLEISERMIEADIAIQNIWNQAYRYYLELLDITGKLSEKPLRNLLSLQHEEI